LYHFGIDGNRLDTEEYIKYYKAIDFKMKLEQHNNYIAQKRALSEIANELFKKDD
jgi:hypothetical protein